MKNFHLIAFVLSGLGSLFGIANTPTPIDENEIKSDTAAVAAYVGLDASPARPVPFPAIKIVPAGDVGEAGPAEPLKEPARGSQAVAADFVPSPAPPPPATPGGPLNAKLCPDGTCYRPNNAEGGEAYANRGRIRRFFFRGRCG